MNLSFIDGVLLAGCCNFKRRGIPQLGTDSNLNCESGLPVGRSKKRKWQLVGVKVDWKCCFLKWPKSHYLHIFWFCFNWRHVRDYPQHCWIQRFPNLHLRPERKLVRCIKPPHCCPRSNNAQCLPHLYMIKTYSHYICKGSIIRNRARRVWFRYLYMKYVWLDFFYLYWFILIYA